jgi:type I restriction enzyme S subunit
MQLTRLGDVAHINPRFDKSSLADDVPVSFVQMASVGASDGKINVSIVRPFAEVKKGSYTPFKDGDVLFAKVTPCMENGKMAIARGLMSGVGFGSSEFHVLRPSDQVDANYLYYFVSSQAFRKEAAGHMTGAVGLRRVPAAFLADAQLPMVPLDEQRRIVAEIETQFSRLDEAVANLQRVKANLKRYKASVLKAAVEGRLVETEASIAQREGRSYETGEQLLHRILDERRSKWKGRGKYKEPSSPDANDFYVLPEGWVWASGDQLTSVITDGEHITPRRTPDGVLLLSARNVLNGSLALEDVDYVPEEEYERIARRIEIQAGDVLLSCSGTVGRSCVVPLGLRFTLVRSVAVLRPVIVLAELLAFMLQSPLGQSQIDDRKTQTAQANLFQGKIRQLVFALPPMAEQVRIVAEVDRLLSINREGESEVDANLQRAQVLRQAILSKQFSV